MSMGAQASMGGHEKRGMGRGMEFERCLDEFTFDFRKKSKRMELNWLWIGRHNTGGRGHSMVVNHFAWVVGNGEMEMERKPWSSSKYPHCPSEV